MAETQKREGIAKTFGLVTILNFISKFFGLLRDIVVLSAFGTSHVADAYNFAYTFTGNILVLFGGIGGPFHSAGVAVLSSRKDAPDTKKLIGQLLMGTFVVLSVISVLIYFLAPFIISLVVRGDNLAPVDRQALWDSILPHFRIMVPLVLIAGLVGLGAGISNTYKEFTWPSLSPAVASIAIIIACIFFKDDMGLCLSMGTLVGAFGQLAVQLPGILRSHPQFVFNFKPQPGLKEYLYMIGPAAIGTSIGQLNVYIDSMFVSSLQEGCWTSIQAANKLLQMPLGILSTAMLVSVLPRFTEQASEGAVDELKAEYRRSLRILWFTVLPLVTILIAIPGPVVELLYKRGNFTDNSTTLVVTALLFLAPSAFFYVARDLTTRVFYAHQDSQTPFRVGIMSLAIKYIADWLLVGPLGLGGITLSTTIVTVFNMTVLSLLLRKKIGPLGTMSLVKPALIMIFASLACGIAAWGTQMGFTSLAKSEAIAPLFALVRIGGLDISLMISIMVSSAVALLVFFVVASLFRLDEPRQVLARVKARIKR